MAKKAPKKAAKKTGDSVTRSETLTPSQFATERLRKMIESTDVDKETKAILKAMKLQTECIIEAIYDAVAAINQH